MAIVTITSDWQKNDFYSGALNGRLLSAVPGAQLIDITHHIEAFNLAEAAFIIRTCFSVFPKGTIHLIGVKSDSRKRYPFKLVKFSGQYFIGADNGVLAMISEETPEEIVELDTGVFNEQYQSFPELTLFIEVAIHLIKGRSVTEIGKRTSALTRHPAFMATLESARIVGRVIYIDSYQNAITNISRSMFEQVGKGRRFDIFVQSKFNRISEISTTYSDQPEGELVALFNSAGLLELALNYGRMAEMLNLDTQSSVRVDFHDPDKDILQLRNT